MRFDLSGINFLTRHDWQILYALEKGAKDHEFVPFKLVCTMTKMKSGYCHHNIGGLLRLKVIVYESKPVPSYRLTTMGYDYLAIKAFMARNVIDSVGTKIGVGKEADVHIAYKGQSYRLAIKIHRLGRTSFRSVKQKRGYLRKGESSNGWHHLSVLSAQREFEYLTALRNHGFPTPQPIEYDRHCILMSYAKGTLLNKIRELDDPTKVFNHLMAILVQIAQAGIVHGDYNEFNIIIDQQNNNEITIIGNRKYPPTWLADFPQVVSVAHPNAKELFNRDAITLRNFFARRYGYEVETLPQFDEIVTEEALQMAVERKHALAITKHDDIDALLQEYYDNLTSDDEDQTIESDNAQTNSPSKVCDILSAC